MSASGFGLARAVLTSADRKLTKAPELRQMSATYAAQTGCRGCPLLGAGCYGERGNVGIHGARLNARAEELGASALDVAHDHAEQLRRLPTDGRPVRLFVVGEAGSTAEARTIAIAAGELQARGGGAVYTYSHHWRTIRRDAWSSVSVLASIERPRDAHTAHRRGYAAALVVGEWDEAGELKREGFEPRPCPEETGTAADCESCRLCMDGDRLHERREVIVFKARAGTRSNVLPVLDELNGRA